MTAVRDAAMLAVANGLSVVPVQENGTKAPVGEWKKYQSERATASVVAEWYDRDGRTGLGIVCGQVSGGLEMLEFEGRAIEEGIGDRFDDAAVAAGLGDLVVRIQAGYCERTPSGGVHLLYRCEVVSGNLKLARRPAADNRVDVLIETRGEGGFTITAPSNGKVHPSGGRWELVSGGFDQIVTITPEERELLHELCRSFNQMPPEVPRERPQATDADGESPGNDFNQRADVAALLTDYGWTHAYTRGEEAHWRRPGKTVGISAVWHGDSRLFVVFSTSTQFETERGYRPFAIYAILNCNGDFSAAARDLRARGYGADRQQERRAIGGPDVDPFTCTPTESSTTTITARPAPAEDEDTSGAPVLPCEFWDARPVLGHIRTAAHSRRTAPDAAFHAVLARLSALTDYTIELPPLVGSPGSLNYYTALIGASGVGKSAAAGVARELLPLPVGFDLADDRPIGSGEGVAEVFYGQIPDPASGKSVRAIVRHHAMFYVDEGEVLAELSDRKAATTVLTLRSGWSGQTLGATNATEDRTRYVPAGSYRLALVVGFQPTKAARILADDVGGTPQRFVWASATDPNIPDERPPWPGVLPWGPLNRGIMEAHAVLSGPYRRHRLVLDPDIEAEVDAAHLARQRGEWVDPLDAHAYLHRLKIAGLLAIADGRMDVNVEDWDLSRMVWETSCAVRGGVVRLIAVEAERTEEARVERAVRIAKASDQTTRLACRLARHVHEVGEPGVAKSDLRRRAHQRERHLFDPAMDEAVSLEWLVAEGSRFYAGQERPA